MAACLSRGLTLDDFDKFKLGQLVDYTITWNEIHRLDGDGGDEQKKPKARRATQSDFDALAGF